MCRRNIKFTTSWPVAGISFGDFESGFKPRQKLGRDDLAEFGVIAKGIAVMEHNAENLSEPTITRRRVLGSAAGATLAAAAMLLPPNVRRALAQTPTMCKVLLKDIATGKKLLMQENRSFDHYFGTMAGVRGFGDPDAIKLSTGKSVFYQPDEVNPKGYLLPFHLDTKNTSAQKIPSTSHAWAVQHSSWNGGKMDNWLPAHRKAEGEKAPYVMGYHTRADIPFQFMPADYLRSGRRVSLFGHGPNLAQSNVLVYRNDRP